jgi:Flp pilus assembly protein TadG
MGVGERGSAALEFALVLPLLLIVVLALVQVGLYGRDALALSEAARAGAREAAVSGSSSDVRAAVDGAAGPLDPGHISMRITRTGGQGSAVSVQLTYSESAAGPLIRWLVHGGFQLESDVTMRQEFT